MDETVRTREVPEDDDEQGRKLLALLDELQAGHVELAETTADLEKQIERFQDPELRWDLERAWWPLEALEEKIAAELEEDERSSRDLTPAEQDRVDRAVKELRKVLSGVRIELVPLWQLYSCRVCGADQGTFMPWGPDGRQPSHLNCSCCGVEFGQGDRNQVRCRETREGWLDTGPVWWDKSATPKEWDVRAQLGTLPAWWV